MSSISPQLKIKIDSSFEETCIIIFGQSVGALEKYELWLGEHVPLPKPSKSALSGNELWVSPPTVYMGIQFEKTGRMIDHNEVGEVATPYTAKNLENLSFGSVSKILKPITYYIGNYRLKICVNFEKTAAGGDGENIYYSEDIYNKVKNIAYCHYTAFSEYMFGCYNSPSSSFCIHCYHSTNLTRCFEMDGCTNCRDSLFCHNSEDLQDCILCFNAKNLKYAVGNIEIEKSEYMRIKTMLVNYIVEHLNKNKKLVYNIYNCRRKSHDRGKNKF